jgi:quercetin dioxygenase-like cupin family protein
MIYLLSGELHFVIAEEEHHILVPGDSLYFQSKLLHRWWNEGDEPVTLIWVNVPLVDHAEPPDARRRASRRGAHKSRRAPRGTDQEG